jgi:hypothetical protein
MRRAWREWRFRNEDVHRTIGYVFIAVLMVLAIVAAGYDLTYH